MSRRGWILFAAMSVIWGIPYLLIKVAVRDISPAALVMCRTGLGSLVLVPLALRRGQLSWLRGRWRPLALYTLVELAVPWVLLSQAERRVPSSLAGLLVATVPLLGAILSLRFGEGERLGSRQIAGLAVGLGGVGLVAGTNIRGGDWLSVGEIGLVALGYALGPRILADHLSDLPGVGVVAASLTLCFALYLPIGAVDLPARFPPVRVVVAVVVLGAVCTSLAFVLFFALIAEAGAVRATLITYLNPVAAVALGVLFLHEKTGPSTLVGAVAILGGSALAAGRSSDHNGS